MQQAPPNQNNIDLAWLKIADNLAKTSERNNEVPVGAIIVEDNQILATGTNSRETKHNPCGHAEIDVITKACKLKKNWRLVNSTLYVTLEPCIMCCGAIQQARIKRVVFGASDPKGGGVVSLYKILEDPRLNHQCEWSGPLDPEYFGRRLKNFFKKKRKQN